MHPRWPSDIRAKEQRIFNQEYLAAFLNRRMRPKKLMGENKNALHSGYTTSDSIWAHTTHHEELFGRHPTRWRRIFYHEKSSVCFRIRDSVGVAIAFYDSLHSRYPTPSAMPVEDLQEREIDLLKRVAKGDRQSFSELYDRFADVLFATALTVTKQHETAEEVVQDVFIQIWRKASSYDSGRGKPLTWAITLTRNRAIDRIRSLNRRTKLLDEVQKEHAPEANTVRKTSFHFMAAAESSSIVKGGLEKLPPDQRQAIEMVFLKGLTMTEAADELGERLPTIKGRVRRGLLRLRELLKGKL